jgi:predicted component of type VI protein secretion system
MSDSAIREQLHKQIDTLPDEVVEQIVDLRLFVTARRKIKPLYNEWSQGQWQDFALSQFFREEDEVEYLLVEAKEVF